jgi:hypothetical protein
MTMMDDFDFDDIEMEDGPPPEESSNRTFLLVAGILGAILILSLILMAVYAMVVVPRRRSAQNTQVAEINAQNTQVMIDSQLTAEAQAWTDTPTITPTQPTETPEPTQTMVIAPTDKPTSDIDAAEEGEEATPEGDEEEEGADIDADDPRTATVAALFTQQAENLLTQTPIATVTQLPDTGFADNLGIPGLLAMAGALILVIFLARRLRMSQ